MSVESEILRIQHNIADSYAKVAEKGGTVPLQPNGRNLASAIVSIPQTLPAPDNNPIGTVISFMGTAAPKDYLVCDGAEYGVSEYPRLAALFREQFGAANYFGGDGETAFAVPDMRNLFLRGFHGGAEERLSGEVGERQEATNHSGTYSAMTSGGKVGVRMLSMNTPGTSYMADHTDTVVWAAVGSALDGTNQTVLAESDLRPLTYTSRPVNMAVLYCIKAVESAPAESVYSTEEQRIGTWIDGKPLYRRVFRGVLPSNYTAVTIAAVENVDTAVNARGFCRGTDNVTIFINGVGTNSDVHTFVDFSENKNLRVKSNISSAWKQPVTIIFEYTKTTD